MCQVSTPLLIHKMLKFQQKKKTMDRADNVYSQMHKPHVHTLLVVQAGLPEDSQPTSTFLPADPLWCVWWQRQGQAGMRAEQGATSHSAHSSTSLGFNLSCTATHMVSAGGARSSIFVGSLGDTWNRACPNKLLELPILQCLHLPVGSNRFAVTGL